MGRERKRRLNKRTKVKKWKRRDKERGEEKRKLGEYRGRNDEGKSERRREKVRKCQNIIQR